MVAVDTLAPFSVTTRQEEFPIFKEYTYLNTAAQGLMPSRTVRAIAAAAERAQFPGTARANAAPDDVQLVRASLARLLNAAPENFYLTGNTAQGMGICAQTIAWRAGDNVVLPEREFPVLTYTWLQLHERGVDVRFVPFDGAGPSVDAIMERVDERTRAVVCSAISWDTGWRADLESLGERCAAAGALLIVDGIQAVGAQPIDVKAARISALSFHGFKWLLAGLGFGVLYVDPAVLDQFAPTYTAGQMIADGWAPGPARYAGSGVNRVGSAALATSLELLEGIGIARVEASTRALTERLHRGLQARPDLRIVSTPDPARQSAITVFTTGSRDGDAALAAKLEQHRIVLSLRPLGLRVSPNFYNTEADIDHLLGALQG